MKAALEVLHDFFDEELGRCQKNMTYPFEDDLFLRQVLHPLHQH